MGNLNQCFSPDSDLLRFQRRGRMWPEEVAKPSSPRREAGAAQEAAGGPGSSRPRCTGRCPTAGV